MPNIKSLDVTWMCVVCAGVRLGM